jgi:hypothetical protein
MMRRGNQPPTPMTKSERADLERLINQRERVLKQQAQARSADVLAEFERQIAQIYSFDQDQVWQAAKQQADEVVRQAQQTIADRCVELGIPAQFAPSLHVGWHARGENASQQRRAELRRVAVTRIAAMEKQARLQIAQDALQAKTAIIAQGLITDAARQFLNELQPLERLMPPLELGSVEQMLDETSSRHRLLP